MKKIKVLILFYTIVLLQYACKKIPNIIIPESKTFVAYPNPCNYNCNLSVYNAPGSNYTITVCKPNGKELIKLDNITNSNLVIDLTNEAIGLYTAIATNGTNSYSLSFIKIKQ
jgi:hypothetical protein